MLYIVELLIAIIVLLYLFWKYLVPKQTINQRYKQVSDAIETEHYNKEIVDKEDELLETGNKDTSIIKCDHNICQRDVISKDSDINSNEVKESVLSKKQDELSRNISPTSERLEDKVILSKNENKKDNDSLRDILNKIDSEETDISLSNDNNSNKSVKLESPANKRIIIPDKLDIIGIKNCEFKLSKDTLDNVIKNNKEFNSDDPKCTHIGSEFLQVEATCMPNKLLINESILGDNSINVSEKRFSDDSIRESLPIKRESPPKEKFAVFLENTILRNDKINSIIHNLDLDNKNILEAGGNGANNDSSAIKKDVSEFQSLNDDKKINEILPGVSDDNSFRKNEEEKPLLKRLQKNPGFPAGLNFGSVIGELKNKTKNANNGALKPVFRKFETDVVDNAQARIV